MKKRRQNIEVFGVAFLDVLTSLLGGVLLILIATVTSSAQKAQAYKAHLDQLVQANAQAMSQLRDAQGKIKQLGNALDEESKGRKEAEKIAGELEGILHTLIGLKGDFKGVVFILDISGSMSSNDLPDYQNQLSGWIESIDYDTFSVLTFNDDVDYWKRNLTPKSPQNISSAKRFVTNVSPGGGTSTLAALKAAFEMKDQSGSQSVDTIVLMTDGKPSDADFDEILKWLDNKNANRKITINTVAIGNYFGPGYGPNLRRIAEEHGGNFIGR